MIRAQQLERITNLLIDAMLLDNLFKQNARADYTNGMSTFIL